MLEIKNCANHVKIVAIFDFAIISFYKYTICFSIILLLSSFPVYSDDSTFCNDPKTWEYFESMTKKYPEDVPLQILHALKIGLCVKIEQNSISTQEAIHLFNDMIDTVANKRGEIEEQEGKEEF